ncbi:ABC transporter substrate-binding protein [Subtercola boreus]|nr:sugar ABC transporter substrate-binding protein [Subtercola boreus]
MAKTPEFGALINAFEAANPDITVQPVDIAAADYSTKITTVLAGGDSTDVIGMKAIQDFTKLSGEGALLDISDLVTADTSAKVTGLDSYKVDNKYYALPYRWDSWVLFYNKDIFDAAGQPYPTTLTWPQYVDLAKKVTSGDGDSKIWGTFQVTWPTIVQNIAAVQTGKDFLGGDYSFMKDQYNVSLDLQKSGAMMDYSTSTSTKAGYAPLFTTGKAAMVPIGSWMISGIQQAMKDGTGTIKNWGIAPMPQIPGATSVTTMGTPTGFAVNKNAKNVDAAKKFVAFTSSAAGAQALAAVGNSPAYQDAASTATLFSLPGMPTDAESKTALSPDKAVLDTPQAPTTAAIVQIGTDEHQLIMAGQTSLDDGLKEMGDRANSEVLNK